MMATPPISPTTAKNLAHFSFIESKTIGDVILELKTPDDYELIDISELNTVEEAFNVLLENDIYSVPVYNKCSDGTKKYIGMVGSLDLLRYTTLQSNLVLKDIPDSDTIRRNSSFLLHPVTSVLTDLAEHSNLSTFDSKEPLSSLLREFGEKRLHRALITGMNPTGPILLSQSDLLLYLFHHNHELGSILDKPAPEISNRALRLSGADPNLREALEHPLTIPISTTALQALRTIATTPISALAVIDASGELIAEISAGDLRGLNRNRMSDLLKPVAMFLKAVYGDLGKPLLCFDRFTLSQIMSGLIRTRENRIWLVDDDERVKGVITLSDVLSMFL